MTLIEEVKSLAEQHPSDAEFLGRIIAKLEAGEKLRAKLWGFIELADELGDMEWPKDSNYTAASTFEPMAQAGHDAIKEWEEAQ